MFRLPSPRQLARFARSNPMKHFTPRQPFAFPPSAPRRFSRSFSYNYSQPFNPHHKRNRFLSVLAVFTVATGASYYLFWPHHTFPSSVAKILRKGLWAESDKGDKDYALALKHYIEALQECDKLELDRLSDEYTGIQLKMGEMYERLGMIDEANFLYNEISTMYLKVLTDKSVTLSDPRRYHLVQKDLRVVAKLVQLNRTNLGLCKAILITHAILPNIIIDNKLGQKLSQLSMADLDSPESAGRLQAVRYLPFLDEYINMMDMLIAINISLGDYSYSINVNLNLNKLMLLVKYAPDKVLLNQCNLGSLLYFQGGVFEAEMVSILKKHGLDIKHKRPDQYANGTEVPEEDRIKFNALHHNFAQCVALASEAYENVTKIANNLTRNVRMGQDSKDDEKEETAVAELVALATYSLGVIHLHLGNYSQSERFLRESRVKSKSCDYQDLLGEIESELGKLFAEKKRLQTNEASR
ncbi:hypothetical protein PSN45_000882 [Yamadazyma tenuis]|uniref:TPR-like protein n=1 Tax=Candida tenuis (strain ATCC 10573 / BCRC 21748 / CBS 615 / JCM 9827 / NBRC 10315 / NRRL Y-1498 / VKM Y-70) TaxID=590646 RepID=G3BBD0_CANTC|nr:uncharacterized protein CANTEDRAFT_115626 [Yamadazyma tenuis ATCC 10573]EGV62156.1 hypothetical protein CANTEDRAFT_115626 [Yamadazyma tenuis ATCC 10573]WEJ93419.1 hypothetical protein PSN45_000882 [Yamadazyma tenuis]